jgi:hypothetical protein
VFTRVTACTLALSPIRDPHSEGFSHLVTCTTAPAASGWSELPGGPCTHWKTSPCHGAHPKRTFAYGRSHSWRQVGEAAAAGEPDGAEVKQKAGGGAQGPITF